MYILGINGSPNLVHENPFGLGEASQHDSAAALLHDGKIIAAFEEERLNRIKHTNKLPLMAMDACLRSQAISSGQIDCFSFSVSEASLQRSLSYQFKLKGLTPPSPRAFIRGLLENRLQCKMEDDKIELFEHHFIHAVTAYYLSGFDDALVLTIDGSGGEYSGSVYEGKGNGLKALRTFVEYQSLGHFYSHVTRLLGFGHFDEYKVMGLAPYGNPATYRKMFEEYYTLLPDGDYALFSERAVNILQICHPVDKRSAFEQVHMDIAAALQETLEKVVFHIVTHFRKVTGHSRLCMAGGVALNCSLNGKLAASGLFKDVFVYPAANDSGLPVGSALAAYFKREAHPRRVPLNTLNLGSEIGNTDDIKSRLDKWHLFLDVKRIKDPCRKAAELLADDKVIGWVQGRSEFAPRALGDRSILADSRPEKNKERINSIVKKREGFRPFAPSVLEEYAGEYFELPENKKDFSYMMFVLPVKENYRKLLGAVTHVDGTARVQTVSREDNEKYWTLIDHFRQITGTPVVLNTSFNNNAEPIVDSVDDAVVCFLTTRLDYLIIDDFFIGKKEAPLEALTCLYPAFAPYMLLKKEVTAAWLPDRRVTQKFVLSNTFNEKTWEVDAKMFEILSSINGKLTLGSLFRQQQMTDPAEKDALLHKFSELWDKRLIILSPAPQP